MLTTQPLLPVVSLLSLMWLPIGDAAAQEAPSPGVDPQPVVAADPAPPPVTYAPPPPPVAYTPPPPQPLGVPEATVSRFRTGRVLYGVGTAVGLIGSGLTVASIVLTSVYGIGSGPGEYGPALAYAGSGASGVAVLFGATGLGLQHSALASVGADTGRGLYATGTLFGILGLAGVGSSYYFGIAKPVDNSETIAFGISIAATALLTVGGILYFADENRMVKVFRRLTTF
jgi:hypothetical protein